MDLQIANQRIFALTEKLTAEQARLRAMDRRTTVFVSGLTTLLQRPRAEEVELLATQRRLEPFWHAVCTLRQVYDRTRKFSVPVSGPEVQAVTLQGRDYPITNRSFTVEAVEHCRDEDQQQLFLDGLSGDKVELSALIAGPKVEVHDLAALSSGESVIIVPPEIRASFVVRQALQPMLKPLQADAVYEETVTIETIDLYYRPIYAYEFRWKTKDRTAVAEFDGVTGEMRNAKALRPTLRLSVSRDALFDVGADTIGMIVPGANIAVKLAKIALDQKQPKHREE
jgi:hypothetical protein